MRLHHDGSTHEWGPGCPWDGMVTRADATSAIYSAFFVEDAETLRRGRGLRAVIERKGRCSSLSTDRGAPSWFTEEAGAKGARPD